MLDVSGNGNHGTLSGATFASGKTATALNLDGIDDFATLDNPSSLQITGSLTISAWVYASAFPHDDAAIVSKRGSDATGMRGYQLDTTVDTGRRTTGFKLTSAGGSTMARYGTTTLGLNTWYHVAGVYDAGARTLNVYLNGQLDSGMLVGTVTSSQQNSGLNVVIGAKSGNPGFAFAGRIDDVRIYNRALAASEIQADMNTAVSASDPPPAIDQEPPTSPANLTASTGLPGSVSLTWSSAADDVGVAAYNVHRSTTSSVMPSAATRIGQTSSTSFTDSVPPGTYFYVVVAQDAAANVSGPSNEATGASAAGASGGPLRRNTVNPRYFADSLGQAVYLVGSHTWSNLKDFGPSDPPAPFDYPRYLDFLQSHNHNFFRLWSWEQPYSTQFGLPPWYHTPFPWRRTGPGLATDGKPKFDLSQLDQAYFDRLRQRVVLAGQRGMYVSVMMWDGFGPQFERSSTDGFPYDAANNVNGVSSGGAESQSLTNAAVTSVQEAYVRKVIDTVNDLDNVLYEIANESGSYSTAWQYHMINVIQQYEAGKPKQHPVGMTYQAAGGTDATLYSSGAAWISPRERVPVSDGTKVILNDTDHSYLWTDLKAAGAAAQQAWVWENFTNGNNILFMDPYLAPWSGRNVPNGSTPDPSWNTIRVAMGRTRAYAVRMNLNLAVPRPTLFSSGYGLAYAAASNAEYLGYLPSGGSITINLGATPGTLSVEWFDPTRGVTSTGTSVTGGASRTLTTPFSGDAVVYLRSPASDTVAPSAPSNLSATGGPGTVSLSWTAATDNVGVTGYGIHRSTSAGFTATASNRIAQVSPSGFVDSVAPGTYYYRVTAQDAAGNVGPASSERSAVATAGSPSTGAVVAYSFDEGSGTNVTDGSGHGTTGTLMNGAGFGVGKSGTAVALDGFNDLVTLGNPTSLQLTGSMTISAWINASALPADDAVIVSKRGSAGGGYQGYQLDTTKDTGPRTIGFKLSSSSGTTMARYGATTLGINQWYHVAGVYDAGARTLTVYLNGQPDNGPLVGTVTSSQQAVGFNAVIGAKAGSTGFEFAGRIDDLRIYDRALSAGEIQNDLNVAVAGGGGQAMTLAATAAPSAASNAIASAGVVSAEGSEPNRAPESVGQWSAPMAWPIVAVHAILLPTGRVLLVDSESFSRQESRVWDPTTGRFTDVATSDTKPAVSAHAALPDGRVLVVGGQADTQGGVMDASAFDPPHQSWARVEPMHAPRWSPTATTLSDGRILVTAGEAQCAGCSVEMAEIYDARLNAWHELSPVPPGLATTPHMFLLPSGRVLAAGAAEAAIRSWILDVDAPAWTPLGAGAFDGGSAAMYRPGLIVKSGSSARADGAPEPAAATTYVLDTTAPSPAWRATAAMAVPRAYHNLTLLPDGGVLATGGGATTDAVGLDEAVLSAERWSPETQTWNTLAGMRIPRLYQSTALLLPDGRVLVAGGGRFFEGPDATDQASAEIYSPPYLFNGPRPTIVSAPSTAGYGMPIDIRTPDASAIAAVSLLRLGSVTRGFNMEQRFVPLSFVSSRGSLRLQAPVDPRVAPPGVYMLFIVNGAGVPSVATMLYLQ